MASKLHQMPCCLTRAINAHGFAHEERDELQEQMDVYVAMGFTQSHIEYHHIANKLTIVNRQLDWLHNVIAKINQEHEAGVEVGGPCSCKKKHIRSTNRMEQVPPQHTKLAPVPSGRTKRKLLPDTV